MSMCVPHTFVNRVVEIVQTEGRTISENKLPERIDISKQHINI